MTHRQREKRLDSTDLAPKPKAIAQLACNEMPPKSGYRYRYNATPEQSQLKPRFPRTSISKIPRQVHDSIQQPVEVSSPCDGTQTSTPYNQSQTGSATETLAAGDATSHHINNRYLTFSKDQATSHFKQLKEELGDQPSRSPKQQAYQMTINIADTKSIDNVSPATRGRNDSYNETESYNKARLASNNEKLISDTENKTSPALVRPKPLERLSKLQHSIKNNITNKNTSQDVESENFVVVVADDKFSRRPNVAVTAPNNMLFRQQPQQLHQPQQPQQQQQPICEAFIMTGDTILKTYTSKSENGCNRKIVTTADTTTPAILATTAPATTTATNTTTSITTSTVSNNNNNNNNGETAFHIKHAQYPRAALLLEQRGKSVSLNKLSDNLHSTSQADGIMTTIATGLDPLLRRRDQHQKQRTVRDDDTNHDARECDEHERKEKQEEEEEEQQQQQQQQQQQREEKEERSARGRVSLLPHEQRQEQQRQEQQQRLFYKQTDVGDRQNSEDNQQHQEHDSQLKLGSKQKIGSEYLISGPPDKAKTKEKSHMDQEQHEHPTPVARSTTLNASSKRQLKQDLSKLNAGQRLDDNDFSIEFKTGFLNRKRVFDARGKPTSKGQRGWTRVYVILRDLRFIIRYDQPEDKEDQENKDDLKQSSTKQLEELKAKTKKRLAAKDLKNAIKLHHAFAKRSTSYSKREYVFHLYLADQSELLLQATSEDDMNSWIDSINFASACLSSPPLPSAILNSKRYHQSSTRSRPILPASYTKLSYWEQLTDHEARLERLKAELEELLNEAPIKRNADKRSKSEYIDRIAYLREKIEHYTVYLDLMQKKSNSHEAIILSKHPQLASLTPSKEMIRSLPIYPQVYDEEDKKGS